MALAFCSRNWRRKRFCTWSWLILASADLPTVHIGAVHATQIADAGLWRVDLQQKVMPRHESIVRQAGVTIGGSAKNESIVLVED
jgi:hypothetical protein